jgi:hypothetical protein
MMGVVQEVLAASVNLQHLAAAMSRFGLTERWAYHFPINDSWFGLSGLKRQEVLQSATF